MSKRRRQTTAPATAQPAQPALANPAQPVQRAVAANPIDDKPALKQLIGEIEKLRGRPCLAYVTSDAAKMSASAAEPLFDQLNAVGKQKSIDVFFSTNGGDSETPIRFVTLIREYCDSFAVLVPAKAQSAGTVFCLGADEIVMTPLSTLGPIDPYRSHPLLPRSADATEPQPVSVQDMRHAMQFIRETAGTGGGGYSPEAMAQIFTALFDKIHPLAIGAIEQSYALAKLVATRCLETHMNPEAESAVIKALVDRLCDDFKSHAYQISRAEAKRIGLKVSDAPADLEGAMLKLLRFYLARNRAPWGTPVANKPFKHIIAWIDSQHLTNRVEAFAQVGPNMEMKPTGDSWVTY